jgi:enoyl-CoA hydratase
MDSMTEPRLRLEARPPLAVLTLASPENGNRLDRQLIVDMRRIVANLAEGGGVRVLILTGEAECFSLGWDVEVLRTGARALTDAPAGSWEGSVFDFVADSPLPTIAAIDGDAFSAGFELALACDLRLASGGARFALPEVGEGRLPMGGGTQRLARLGGRGVALEMILTGETIDAAGALARGLVSAVVDADGLLDAAERQARVIAEHGPIALRLAKEAVAHGLDMPLPQALRLETDLTVLLQTTHDRAEGVAAFKEKRTPHFTGS